MPHALWLIFSGVPVGDVISLDTRRTEAYAAGFDDAADTILEWARLADAVNQLSAEQADVIARAAICLRARAANVRKASR